MTAPIAIKGLAGVEHLQADGSYAVDVPTSSIPPAISASDRLRVRLEVADTAWIYAVSVFREAGYVKLGAWGPLDRAGGGVRMLWPGGRVWTADEITMTTLVVIASTEALPWAEELTRADCASLVDKMPPRPPITACDHLYGLLWKVPPRPRGIVPVNLELLEDGETRMLAVVAQHRGAPYTAIEWQFKPRR